jgi:hypothetical protein
MVRIRGRPACTKPGLLLSVAVPLPPGRLVTADEGDGSSQPLRLSDGPASAEPCTHLYADRARTGLWPLLLDSNRPREEEFRRLAGARAWESRWD